MRANY